MGLGHWSATLAVAGALFTAWLGQHEATFSSVASPGPLSELSAHGQGLGGVRSHADLQGRCESCHAPTWSESRMTELCQQCHSDVVARAGGGCETCHTEHLGPNAPRLRSRDGHRAHPELATNRGNT